LSAATRVVCAFGALSVVGSLRRLTRCMSRDWR
jgi:hypothetical protein